MPKRKKIYVYVDESGQDRRSEHFIVVAVVTDKNQEDLRLELLSVEEEAQTNKMKWHKTRHERRIDYLTKILDRKIATKEVYFGRYKKPLPYFFPMINVLEHAIKNGRREGYIATVYVDGIDKVIARKLTNALRSQGISLRAVQSRREESEPLIRFADMWAGCIRGALLHGEDSKKIFKRATESKYMYEVTT
jgi:hypothetical protein